MVKHTHEMRMVSHPRFIQKKFYELKVPFALKLFCFFFELDKTRKNSPSWQSSYFCMEKMAMLQIHTFTQCFEQSGVQMATSNFIYDFHYNF